MNAKNYAEALGIPLNNNTPEALLLGGSDYQAAIELVKIGDSMGFAGAPIHIEGEAYSPMVVIRLWDNPILVIDPSQGDVDEIKNLLTPLMPEWERIMNKAESGELQVEETQ